MISSIDININMDPKLAPMMSFLGALTCVLLLGIVIAIACVRYYNRENRSKVEIANAETRRTELDAEARKAKSNERIAVGPSAEDYIASVEQAEALASALQKIDDKFRYLQGQTDSYRKTVQAITQSLDEGATAIIKIKDTFA